MIQIIPMENKTRELELLANQEEGNKVLLMEEGSSELGWVSVNLKDKTLKIIEFSLTSGFDIEDLDMEEHFYLDTLMRSAASYGETNGADKIVTANNLYNSFLKKKGFETDENGAFTPMSTIVHYT